MTKYAYEYGKRWDVRTPRDAIGYIVDAMHVGESLITVASEIDARIAQSSDLSAYTPAIRRQCHAYAILRHNKNRELYNYVARGY